MDSGALYAALRGIETPAYVVDIAALRRNRAILARLKQATGATLLLATKAFALPPVFDEWQGVLDGTTASGLYEARLGAAHVGGEVHAYAPAFRPGDLPELSALCSHIAFNSLAQLNAYAAMVRVPGLRLHAGLSQVRLPAMYDPAAPDSRFGVSLEQLSSRLADLPPYLHVHNLCENQAEDGVALIEHLSARIPEALHRVREVNLGGGHYITHPEYALESFIEAVQRFQARFNVRVILEPGGAWVYDAGVMVARVLDILPDRTPPVAILDASATCHMPDVLEVPYRPALLGEDPDGPYAYQLAGPTCLAGDRIGTYRFAGELAVGDCVIFADMLQYSFVKNTTFNGIALPDIGALYPEGRYVRLVRFGYEAFAGRVGAL